MENAIYDFVIIAFFAACLIVLLELVVVPVFYFVKTQVEKVHNYFIKIGKDYFDS